jgi:hypothetical protein
MKKRIITTTAIAAALALAIPATASAHQAAAHPASVTSRTVTYAASDAVIPNPARGFYHSTETHYLKDGSGYEPLDLASLRAFRNEGVTQILREFWMEKFVDQKKLDPKWLKLVQKDYDTARKAGVSVITRFAYVQGGDFPYNPPYGDADVDTVLAHIKQLTPILRKNADVLPVLQEGFIGLWGEGYYTDHFAADPANPGVLTDTDWANRNRVAAAELKALPTSRGIQVRTMQMKQKAVRVPSGTEGALTPAEAHDGSAKSRIGHHNDCFLAAPDDWGTFLTDPLSLDQDYLAADSRYVAVGGETCNVDAPRSEFPSAAAEMAKYHYSYLNRDYHPDVLASWGEAGLTETSKKLGYRFVMKSSTVTAATKGHTPKVSVKVANEGWSAPYNSRPVKLVLTSKNRTITVPIKADADTWQPGKTVTVSAALKHVPRGTYSVALALPAPEKTIDGNSNYAIQTANVGTWNARAGVNDLKQKVTVR